MGDEWPANADGRDLRLMNSNRSTWGNLELPGSRITPCCEDRDIHAKAFVLYACGEITNLPLAPCSVVG